MSYWPPLHGDLMRRKMVMSYPRAFAWPALAAPTGPGMRDCRSGSARSVTRVPSQSEVQKCLDSVNSTTYDEYMRTRQGSTKPSQIMNDPPGNGAPRKKENMSGGEMTEGPAYVIGHLTVKDPEKWAEYRR